MSGKVVSVTDMPRRKGKLRGMGRRARIRIFAERGGRCERCHCDLTEFEIHHRLPRSRGGTNREANLELVCPPCHAIRDAECGLPPSLPAASNPRTYSRCAECPCISRRMRAGLCPHCARGAACPALSVPGDPRAAENVIEGLV